jgi:predicted phage terminase large subunit-like protein
MSCTQERLDALRRYADLSGKLQSDDLPPGAAGEARELCVADLFYLLHVVMQRGDMNNDWCFARCREIREHPDGFLDLWARGHYKSTIITVGLTIQNILHDPEITAAVFSHTRPIAKSFLRQIKREFEGNRLLQALFPHIMPPQKGEKRTWSEDDGLVARRAGNPKEATVEAWGLVDGQPTGKHFSLVVYDDIVSLESTSTPEMIRKTTDAWRLSLNLGTSGGIIRMIGTRYHAADTYHTILQQGSVTPRTYPATADGTPHGPPVLLSSEALACKRRDMGPFVYACQMLQDPLADKAQGFAPEWFRTIPDVPDASRMNRYIIVDPASSKKQHSDYTSMWVVGLHNDNNYYILDGIRDRLNLAERARALFLLHRKHRPLAVGYEHYGMQADIEHLHYLMAQHNYRFTVIALGGSMPKTDRIRRLVPHFEQGRIFFPARLLTRRVDDTTCDLTNEFLQHEYSTFPVSSHDDMLDCLSRILDPELHAGFPLHPAADTPALPEFAAQFSTLWNEGA